MLYRRGGGQTLRVEHIVKGHLATYCHLASVAWQLVYLCYTWKSVHCGASRISSVCIYYGNCHIHIISRPN